MNTAPRLGAFSLVEVTLALGVMSFCMVALYGLLPVGLNSNQSAVEQTAAAAVASAVAADLRQTPLPTGRNVSPVSPRFRIPVPSKSTSALTDTAFFTEDGIAVAVNADAPGNASPPPRYRATISYTLPAVVTDRTATSARLVITWPALADAFVSATPAHFAGSFETVIALDRN